MVGALGGSSPGQDHCIVFLRKILYCNSASLPAGVFKLVWVSVNSMLGVTGRSTSIPSYYNNIDGLVKNNAKWKIFMISFWLKYLNFCMWSLFLQKNTAFLSWFNFALFKLGRVVIFLSCLSQFYSSIFGSCLNNYCFILVCHILG